MEPFNHFQEVLDKAIIIDKRYHILAAEGYKDVFVDQSISKVVKDGDTYKRIELGNPPLSGRSSESEKMTTLSLLIYDPSTESLDWKCTYMNTKGVYFKKHREKYYI